MKITYNVEISSVCGCGNNTQQHVLFSVLHLAMCQNRQSCGISVCTKLAGKMHLILNLLKPTGHVMHQQFNIQQLYALSTLYLCVLYLSENKQRLVPLTA